jgi:methyl-accepting chemotaxis protein
MATIADLEELQDGISASIQTLLQAYNQCADPVESATILSQSQQLAAQMSQIETNLFHQQAIQVGATVDNAFASARGFTSQLKDLAKSLDRVSDIITTGAKLVGVVTQIISVLAL